MCNSTSNSQSLAISSVVEDSSEDADISASSTEDFLMTSSTDEEFVEKADKLGRVSEKGKK